MQVVHSASDMIEQSMPNNVGASVLVGLVGHNILRSRTPGMHEAEGARLNLRYTYKFIDTAKLANPTVTIGEVVDAARICGFAGLNITYPFKQTVIPYLDVLAPDAERVGAVNSVVFRDGKSIGHNTDEWGFAEGFRQEMPEASLNSVLQIGAGGAGSAVANALVQLGAKNLVVTDLDMPRAEALAQRLNEAQSTCSVKALPMAAAADQTFDGIVNTTPVGMDKTPGMPVDVAMLRPQSWVSDIIYFPLETELLRTARSMGCRTFSGAGMALFQAVKAFELFTGLVPDSASMKATFDAFTNTDSQTI